jgi:hypothetical protein
MSRKHKRQKQRKSFSLSLVAIGGVLFIIAVFFFANQGGGDGGGLHPLQWISKRLIMAM